MLRIGICDDIYDARLQLRWSLERLLEQRGMEAAFVEFSSGEALLRWMGTHSGEIDLVFLDMKMGKVDGMETARRLRQADAFVQLVFVTSYTDRVFDGYSVGALGYLIKPAKQSDLDDILNRTLSFLYQAEEKTYVCRYGDVTYRIPYQKIRYFASERRKITCVTSDRSFTFYDKLDNVAAQVGNRFVRIHQRYLVYAPAVECVSATEVRIGGETLPMSRSMRQSAMLALTRASLED